MMVTKIQQKDQLLRANFDQAWFETVFGAMDRLHDEVSAGDLRSVSPLPPALMVGWLEDIIFTAQEAIDEIRAGTRPVTEAEPVGATFRLESEAIRDEVK